MVYFHMYILQETDGGDQEEIFEQEELGDECSTYEAGISLTINTLLGGAFLLEVVLVLVLLLQYIVI